MNRGLSAVHTSYEVGSFSIPTTIIRSLTDGSNWLPPGHIIGEVTEVRMSRTRSEQNYSSKTDFQTRRVNHYFERKNISMSRPPLESTHFGTNMTNRTTSPIDSILFGTKIPEPMPRTRPTDSPTLPTYSSEQNGKAHLPGEPYPDPLLPDSSSKKI